MSWLKEGFARLEQGLGPWVVRWRWQVLVCTATVLATCGAGLTRLRVDNNTRVFFGGANPQFQALRRLEQTFSNEQQVVLIIRPKAGTIFTRQSLAVIQAVTEACWRIPYCRKVHSVTNHPHIQVEGDELMVSRMVADANSLEEQDLEAIREAVLSDKALVDLVVSPSGHCTAVHVGLQLPGRSSGETSEVAGFCQGLVAQFKRSYPDVEFYLTGAVIVDQAFGDAARRDLVRLAPIMLLVLTVLVGIALRSFWATCITMATIIASMISGLGLAGWLGLPINAASAGAPVLILTLSVADTVHLLATMITGMRGGQTKMEAIMATVRSNLKPVFLTNVTTIFGFSGVNLSESPPFRELANVVNIGVTAAFFYSMLLLPALAAVLPVRVSQGHEPSPLRLTRYLTGLSIKYYRPVLIGVAVLFALCCAGLAMIEFDDNYLTYLNRSYEFRRATDFMVENLTGWDIIEYALPSGGSNGVADPCYLQAVDRFANWYRQQPRVRYVGCFADIIKRINQLMHGNDPDYYRIPDQRELMAQYLLLYEMSLPPGHDLNDQIDVDRSTTRMMVLFEAVPSSHLRRIEKLADSWLSDNAPAWMRTGATGLSLVWAYVTERNVRSMFWGSLVSLTLVSGCLLLGLRSVRLALVSLLPNLIPPLMAFGIWGGVFHTVGLGLSVVVAMTIGIVVDDTIHFLTKYQEARRTGLDVRDSIRKAFYAVGMAMWMMTVALVAGFLVLTLSDYRISVEMGLICTITFGIACWMDYLILPGALILVDRRRGQRLDCPPMVPKGKDD